MPIFNQYFSPTYQWNFQVVEAPSNPDYVSLATYLKWRRSLQMKAHMQEALQNHHVLKGLEILNGRVRYLDPSSASVE